MLCSSQYKSIERGNADVGYCLESTPDYRVRIFQKLQDVPADWETAQPAANIFLQRPYLSVVEAHPPKGYNFAYLIFYRNEQPVGVCYCQLLEFKTDGALREENTDTALSKAANFFKGFLIKKLSIKLLICGNALLTGEHGFYFKEGISSEKQFALIADAMNTVREYYAEKGEKLRGFFIKDFPADRLKACGEFEKRDFHRVHFQPNMVMDIPVEWKTYDDYMAAFSSKYRTRARRAFKKGGDFVKREMTKEHIRAEQKRIFELYQGIEKGAGFSFAHLNPGYFCGLKDALGPDFSLTGYWLDDKLVGFYTTIKNGKELEAHFIGFESQLNRTHQIYLNMLYDMVAQGIEKGAEHIVFARTASEIKSSVGAVAEEMYCYTRHHHDLPNRFVPKIFSYLTPTEEWTPRNPFN